MEEISEVRRAVAIQAIEILHILSFPLLTLAQEGYGFLSIGLMPWLLAVANSLLWGLVLAYFVRLIGVVIRILREE